MINCLILIFFSSIMHRSALTQSIDIENECIFSNCECKEFFTNSTFSKIANIVCKGLSTEGIHVKIDRNSKFKEIKTLIVDTIILRNLDLKESFNRTNNIFDKFVIKNLGFENSLMLGEFNNFLQGVDTIHNLIILESKFSKIDFVKTDLSSLLIRDADIDNLFSIKQISIDKIFFIELNIKNFTSFSDSISGVDNLTLISNELVITHNQIESLPEGLKQLIINKNSFANNTIGNSLFKKLSILEFLDLTDNKIRTINLNAFTGLNNLITLKLSQNNIFKIEKNSFSLFSLLNLELKNNSIERIESFSFTNTKNLKTLDLSMNKLTIIQANVFNDMTELVHLNLKYNEITNVEKNSLNGLKKLNDFNMDKQMKGKIRQISFKSNEC